LRAFSHRYLGQLATIGAREAVAEVMGFHFRGFFAWWLWRTIYLAKLPGVMRRLRVTIDWTVEAIFRATSRSCCRRRTSRCAWCTWSRGRTWCGGAEPMRAVAYLRRGRLHVRGGGAEPAAGPAVDLAVGAVVDQAWCDGEGRWRVDITAAEASDVVVFRGRALELLRQELRLERRLAGGSAPEDSVARDGATG
jgi:NADH dehydrogenase